MGKRKLTDDQIINIAKEYANGSDEVNESYLAKKHHVSQSAISNYLNFSISNCLIDENIATLIAKKIIRHNDETRKRLGYPKSNKVRNKYNLLLQSYASKEKSTSELANLTAQYNKFKNDLETFDETFSKSDNYPYTKDDLIKKMDFIQKQINCQQENRQMSFF